MDAAKRFAPPPIESRLPKVGTTIFTVMSQLAVEKNAVNLGQGFPDFDCDPRLTDAVADAMRAGLNQYAPMAGAAELRRAIADKIASTCDARYDWNHEITVTAGATQAIFTAVLAIVRPGDEVIVIEPAYDSYLPAIELAGGKAVTVPMGADFRVPWASVRAALGARTRAILVNSPHNPSGTILRDPDLRELESIVAEHGLFVVSDEVYEHMVYDGEPHQSVSRYPRLAARAFVVSSFGKTFHVTGWKVGYCAAPAPLMAEFRKVHQFNVFTVNTPMQHGLARYLADPEPYRSLPAFYQRKRDLFREGLGRTRLLALHTQGSYFQCVDYRAVSALGEADFCRWLTREAGVAAIPLSAFYDGGFEQGIVRLCFAKKDETLLQALERLARI